MKKNELYLHLLVKEHEKQVSWHCLSHDFYQIHILGTKKTMKEKTNSEKMHFFPFKN